MIDRKEFFKGVRSSFVKLTQSQVDGFNAILDEWKASGLSDTRWLAYMLATAWHETAFTMQPITERGKRSYFNKYEPGTKVGKNLGNKYPGDGYLYRGRGFVQITGRANYVKMGKILEIDLVVNPDKALDPVVAVKTLFEGMTAAKSFRGDFTGKCLENYFNKKTDDPINARRIINGIDKAKLIASHHHKFLNALTGHIEVGGLS